MADWYYTRDGKQEGPVSVSELKEMGANGDLGPDDMVFQVGGKDWVKASTVKGLIPAAAPKVTAKPEPVAKRPSKAQIEEEGDGAFPTDDGDDDAPRGKKAKAAKGGEGGGMGDLLMFRRMIAPTIVLIVFWIGVLGVCAGGFGGMGLGAMQMGTNNGFVPGLISLVGGLVLLPFGILTIRLACEVQIVIFRIHETLTEIKQVLQEQKKT
jgi:hypothetical protein